MIELLAVTRDLPDWIQWAATVGVSLATLVVMLWKLVKYIIEWRTGQLGAQDTPETIAKSHGNLKDPDRKILTRALVSRKKMIQWLAVLLILFVVTNGVAFGIRHYLSQPSEVDELPITEAARINLGRDPWLATNSLLLDLAHELVSEAGSEQDETRQWAIVRISTDQFGETTGNRPIASSKWRIHFQRGFEIDPPYVFVVQGGPVKGFVRGVQRFDSDGFPGFEIPESSAATSLLVIGVVHGDKEGFPTSFDNFFKLEPVK